MSVDPVWALEQSALRAQRALDDALAAGDDSDIQRFYSGLTVLVTGATGFLGKLLVEKLLRSCPKIERIYILVRKKKGREIEERKKEMLDDRLFSELRRRRGRPELAVRVRCVAGDAAELGLGLCERDRDMLAEQVDVIFHGAATVRFDEPLRRAVLVNVRGTRELLALAARCPRLRALVHISTAYCNCPWRTIEERFYECPVPYDAVIRLAEAVDDDVMRRMTPALLGEWPNTYTFTKAMAELVVRDMSGNIPTAVIRPAIVTGTYKAPCPGWCDQSCVYGPTGVILGFGVGALKTFLADTECAVDLVPGDLVANACAAVAWRTAAGRAPRAHPAVYSVGSSNRNPIGWVDFRDILERSCAWMLSPRTVWYCTAVVTPSASVFFLLSLLFHIIPAHIVDGVGLVLGKDLKTRVAAKKLYKFAHIMSYFNLNEWKFQDNNTRTLAEGLSEKDRDMFPFDVAGVDWDEYMQRWLLGMRKYIVKDELRGTAESVRRQKLFRVLHYALIAVYVCIGYKLIYLLLDLLYFIFGCLFR